MSLSQQAKPPQAKAEQAKPQQAPQPAKFTEMGLATPAGDPKATGPSKVSDPGQAGLQALLGIEAEARAAQTRPDLLRALSNAPRRLLGYRQSVVLTFGRAGMLRAEAVTSLAAIDRSSPFITWVEGLAIRASSDAQGGAAFGFQLPAYANPNDPDTQSFPFRNFMLVPLRAPNTGADGDMLGVWLCAREQPFNDGDFAVAERLAGTYVHALGALQPGRGVGGRAPGKSSRRAWWAIRSLALVAMVLGAFMPVPLSTLAPVEVAPSRALVVAAGMNGVISDVLVSPGDEVAKGDVLVSLDEVDLVNRLEVAERSIEVAQAKLWRSNQAAFGSADAKRDLAIARSELRVAQAEHAALVAEQKRTVLRAPAAGIAMFKDRRDLIGKPVSTGERLMQVADPANPEFRIDLPVADVMLLKMGTPVRVFLDADPLNALEAQLTKTSYHARPTAEGVLAYRLTAQPSNADSTLRVGARGSAKLIGDDVPLYFFLLRRPIAAVRQWTGW